MGFNPHRRMKRRPSDYVIVAVALLATLALLVWALAG
jgi:hypothetical protein